MSKYAPDGRLSGSCSGCPFNDGATEEATQGQNYGCLPSGQDILRIKAETGQNWACHEDETSVCKGLCHSAKEKGLPVNQGGLIRYTSWYHQGEEAAIEEAKTGILFTEVTGEIFDKLVYGHPLPSGGFEPPKWEVPKLKYYDRRPAFAALTEAADRRNFFVALGQPTAAGLRPVMGLIQMEQSPYESDVLWLCYISVSAEKQNQGIAKKLLTRMADAVLKSGKRLELSYSTEEGKLKIQAFLHELLYEREIDWTQSGC